MISTRWPVERLLSGLAIMLAAATGALIARPTAHVYDTPLTEDGYYALAVARNVAAGHGISIDGIHLTNGFQPLFTLLEAGAYCVAGGNDHIAIRLVFALSWAIYLSTGWLLGRIAADAISDGDPALGSVRGWLAGLLYIGGFLSFMHGFNGLETGLVVFGYAALWRGHQIGLYDRPFGWLLLGIGLGVLVLIRIDAAFFTVAIVLWQIWRRRLDGRATAILRGGSIGLVALLVSAPWWVYNDLVFGALMPTSGTAQQAFGLNWRRLRWVFWALGADGLPTLWLGRYDEIFHDGILPSLGRALVAGGLIVAGVRRFRAGILGNPSTPKIARTLEFGLVIAATMTALALYYLLNFIAFWFYYRYLFPVVVLSTVAIAIVAAPWVRRWPMPASLILLILALPTLVSAVMAQFGHTLHVQTVYWEQLQLIDAHVPADAPVAAGQAGTLGYFRKATVNVDGKVNADAVPFQTHMWDFLAAHDVHWFADWPFYIEKYLGKDPAAHGWKHVADLGYWQLWKRN